MSNKEVINVEVDSNIGEVSKDASGLASNFRIMGVSLIDVKKGFFNDTEADVALSDDNNIFLSWAFFEEELLNKEHDINSDTIKIALIKSGESGTYNASTTNYSNVTGNSDEASGAGYSAGGVTLQNANLQTSGEVAFVDFDDVSWTSSTISASGAIIYNSSVSNIAIAVLSYGVTVSSSSGTFTLTMPTNNSSNALLRLS